MKQIEELFAARAAAKSASPVLNRALPCSDPLTAKLLESLHIVKGRTGGGPSYTPATVSR